jgi:hypothetical protein
MSSGMSVCIYNHFIFIFIVISSTARYLIRYLGAGLTASRDADNKITPAVKLITSCPKVNGGTLNMECEVFHKEAEL